MKTRVAIVDDHDLVSEALEGLINRLENYEVIFKAGNGLEMTEKIENVEIDVILLDIQMPHMNGFETLEWLAVNKPDIKVLVLSMLDNDQSIIRLLRLGAKGFVKKGSKSSELKHALDQVVNFGIYHSAHVSSLLINLMNNQENLLKSTKPLTESELIMVRLMCTEDTYTEIASKLNISIKTLEKNKEIVFEKIGVKSRHGLAIEALKMGLIKN